MTENSNLNSKKVGYFAEIEKTACNKKKAIKSKTRLSIFVSLNS